MAAVLLEVVHRLFGTWFIKVIAIILLAHDPFSSFNLPTHCPCTITHTCTPLIAGSLPIKVWLLGNGQPLLFFLHHTLSRVVHPPGWTLTY